MGGTFAFASEPPEESREVIAGLAHSNAPSLRCRARNLPRRAGGRRSDAEHPARRSGSSASSQKRSLDGSGVAELTNKSEEVSNAFREEGEEEKSIGSKSGFNEISDNWSIGGDNVSVVKRSSDGKMGSEARLKAAKMMIGKMDGIPGTKLKYIMTDFQSLV